MIDLHCHLLPGLDDGPGSLDESARLAAALARDGATTVAATPHLRADYPAVRPAELAGRVAELERQLHARGLAVQVVVGGELDVTWAHRASDEDLRLVSYGQAGSTLLLETPYGPLPEVFEHVVERLRERGFQILLAHPERSPTFQHDPGRLERMVRDGVLVQLTAMSLVTGRRTGSRKLARRLLERGAAHILASDAHSADGDGRVLLSRGLAAVAALSPELSRWMVEDAPAALLAREAIGPPPEVTARRAGRLGRGRRDSRPRR